MNARRNALAAAAGVAGLVGAAGALTMSPRASTSPAINTVSGGEGSGAADATSSSAMVATAQTAAAPSFLSSTSDFPNPERGFYRWISPGYLDQWTQSDATDAYNNGYRLVLARVNLEDYKNTDTLPAAYIAQLNTALGYARAAGVKVILRAVYNYPKSETDLTAGDAELSRIKTHIAQLTPTFQNNADVIAFVQAGFVGVWGEWHSSKNGFDDETPGASNWAEVKDALVAAIPDSRFIQFRYPKHLMSWVPQSALPTVAGAIQNKFRFGFHNDCFLSGVADIGTYSDDPTIRSQERTYADRLGDVGPVGGETCDSRWSETAVRRSTCADILGEGAKYNFTYLNIGYWRPEFHDMWEANGCMADVRRKMGYRFALASASHPDALSRGATLDLNFSVVNSGWARLFNEHPIQIILQNTSTNAYVRLATTGADPRAWVPGSTAANASVAATVPTNLPTGQYRVLIALVDRSLPTNPKFAIRFANENNPATNQYWDSALAAFNLGTVLQIS